MDLERAIISLRNTMKANGISQKELAERVNLDPSRISNLLKSRNLTLKTLNKLAEALDLTLNIEFIRK